jgi:hypothetical protein
VCRTSTRRGEGAKTSHGFDKNNNKKKPFCKHKQTGIASQQMRHSQADNCALPGNEGRTAFLQPRQHPAPLDCPPGAPPIQNHLCHPAALAYQQVCATFAHLLPYKPQALDPSKTLSGHTGGFYTALPGGREVADFLNACFAPSNRPTPTRAVRHTMLLLRCCWCPLLATFSHTCAHSAHYTHSLVSFRHNEGAKVIAP